MKRCYTCGSEKELSEFYRNKSRKDGYHDECKVCTKKERRRYYANTEEYRKKHRAEINKIGKNYYRCNKVKILNKYKEVKKTNKKWLYEYLGNYCKKCGYDKCLSALHVHHIDPRQKKSADDTISVLSKSLQHEAFKKKIISLKCIILCANCHAELHEDERAKNLIR